MLKIKFINRIKPLRTNKIVQTIDAKNQSFKGDIFFNFYQNRKDTFRSWITYFPNGYSRKPKNESEVSFNIYLGIFTDKKELKNILKRVEPIGISINLILNYFPFNK